MRESYGEAEDKRYFSFYYDDQQGKSVTMDVSTSDGANGIVKEFEKFMKACGYIADGHLTIHRPAQEKIRAAIDEEKKNLAPRENVVAQPDLKSKFDFGAIPNNNWLFGELKAEPLPGITSIDLSAIKPVDLTGLTVTDLATMTTHSWSEWSKPNQYPTMAPLTTEQIYSWSTDMPGTLGGAKVKF